MSFIIEGINGFDGFDQIYAENRSDDAYTVKQLLKEYWNTKRGPGLEFWEKYLRKPHKGVS